MVDTPAQTVVAPPVAVMVGIAFTVIAWVAVVVQLPVTPVTVYVRLAVVVVVTVAPVVALRLVAGLHVYDVDPDAVMVVEEPVHIDAEPTAMLVNGTVMVLVAVLEQPIALVPVTVYVLVEVVLQVTVVAVVEFSPVAGLHA